MASLREDIAPELPPGRGQVCLMMAQSLLQGAIQRLEGELQILVAEHNEMAALFRALAERLADASGLPAERIRQRGVSLGGCADIPAPVSQKELAETHHRLSQGLIETLTDLDLLLAAGDTRAAEALRLVRGHLALRSGRDYQILTVQTDAIAGRQ
jgi:hypothetical protein